MRNRFLLSLTLGLGACTISKAQATVARGPEVETTQSRVTALRDDFVARVYAHGFKCALSEPVVVVKFVPSFGDYDDATNTVTTSDWTMLPPEQERFFFQLAGPGAKEADAHKMFEESIHRWMFVHELAHWWQTCRSAMAGHAPFELGVEADRITLAYWREAEPAFPAKIAAIVQGLIDHAPNPVPAGRDYKEYFNQNYGTLGPAMPWFAAHMILTAYSEKPVLNFKTVLAETK